VNSVTNTKISQRGNHGCDHWEINEETIRHGRTEGTGWRQGNSRHHNLKKIEIWDDTETTKWTQRGL
jgi:hypothetical protein